jgi:tetratricopeptide (TPR) repeat protein
VSSATTTDYRSKNGISATPFEMAKNAIALGLVLLLAFMGVRGREQALLQARINEVTLLRDQLLEKMDEDPGVTLQVLRPIPPASSPGLINKEIRDVSEALRTQLGRFKSDYDPRQLARSDRLEIQLSKATLANAEQRFTDALNTFTQEDEEPGVLDSQHQNSSLFQVLQIRADSFYGLRRWEEALQRYQQLRVLRPNRLVVLARIASCQSAQGRTNVALTAAEDLAKGLRNRGNELLVEGKSDEAIGHYEQAVEIQSWLREQKSQPKVAGDLAMSHRNLGDALLLREKPELAADQYKKAIDIQRLLVERQGRKEFENDLALSYYGLGNALLGQQQLASSLTNYDEAIALQTRVMKASAPVTADDLARSYNNRGVVLRVQGKVDDAIGEFEEAINIMSPLFEPVHRGEPDGAARLSATPSLKVDVVFEFTEEGLELSTRARFADQGRRRALGVALAIGFKNLGYSHLLQRKLNDAFVDFKKAMEIYGRLVDQDGQKDLALEFAESIAPVAWIYATHPDSSTRDGRKARAYALRACNLSEWKVLVPVVALAAACAETGDFTEAIKWQQKAIDLAPAAERPQLLSELQLYESGKPYRLK